MAIHRIKLQDLTADYVKALHQQYAEKEVSIEIHVLMAGTPPKAAPSMSEALFWQLIAQLDWSKLGNDELVIEPVVQQLSQLSERNILTFYDLLSEKLYLLDGKVYADYSLIPNETFSSDLFLYARCCVVANGRQEYEKVLQEPHNFPKQLYFEKLLQLPEKAWFRKTGQSLSHRPKYIYETGFNPSGWGAASISL